MLEENKKTELNQEQVEDVDGGLLAEVGLATAMIFGQVSPVMAEMEPLTQVQETSEQASTIQLTKDNVKLVNTLTENGNEQTQEVKVIVNGVELEKDKEYTVKDNKATAAGVYKLTVEGKDMYSGKVEVQYVVSSAEGIGSGVSANPENPAEQTKDIAQCTVDAEDLTYNGSPQVPEVTITDAEGNVLTPGVDYQVNTQEARQQEVGTYQFSIIGLGDYEGSSTIGMFTITQNEDPGQPEQGKDLNSCTVNTTDLTYNGSPQVPEVTITDAEGNVLTPGVDYQVNTQEARQQEVGTYQFSITGLGEYEGSSTIGVFVINKADTPVQPEQGKDLKTCTVTVAAATYNASPQLPDVTVKDANGNTLTAGTDYELNTQEARQENVGTYKFTVVGLNDYKDTSTTATFTISPAPIANCTTTVDPTTYNGSPQVPNVTIKDVNGNTLTAGTDYEVNTQEARQQNAGTYKFTIVGHGNYEGTNTTASFTINQATLGDDNVKLSESLVYNKKEQTQKVTVTFNGMTLTEGTDYEVTNNKATNTGNYTLTVTGKGNFTGKVNKVFTIYSDKQAVHTAARTNVALYAGIASIAAAGLGALAVLTRKRFKH